MHNNDEINEAIQRFKLTKKDQQLLVAGATLMTVATAGAMATTTNAHADTVKNNNVKTEQVNKVDNNVNNGWHANSVAQIKQAIQKQGGNVYTIQYGDTLSAIAQAMNINMTTLQQINHIANANVIIAGNKIGFSADHQNVQVMNNQGKVIAQAPVHANAPVAPVVNHAVATPVAHVQAPVAHTATPTPVVHTTTVNKPVTTTHTEYVPQQVTTTKEVPTQVTANQTKTVTKNVPVTTTDANGNQTTTMKPETTTETVPVTTTVNKPVTVTDTTNQPTTTTTTTPSQTPSSSVDNGSSSVANTTTSTTNNSNSNVDNSSSSSANTANSGQLVNGYTPQQPSTSSSANSSSQSSSANSSSSQASQSSTSSSSMSNGYQPQQNQNSNSTEPQLDEYVTNGNGFDYQGFINYFNADSDWQGSHNSHISEATNSFTPDINIVRNGALRLINQIRANAGVAPVQYNDYLNNLAQAHAENSAEHSNQEITHYYIDNNGNRSNDTFDTHYIEETNQGNNWGSTSEDGTDLTHNQAVSNQDVLDKAFSAWLNDQGHREMLISPDYKYIGLGYKDGYVWLDGDTPVSEGGVPLGHVVSQITNPDGSGFQISVN